MPLELLEGFQCEATVQDVVFAPLLQEHVWPATDIQLAVPLRSLLMSSRRVIEQIKLESCKDLAPFWDPESPGLRWDEGRQTLCLHR